MPSGPSSLWRINYQYLGIMITAERRLIAHSLKGFTKVGTKLRGSLPFWFAQVKIIENNVKTYRIFLGTSVQNTKPSQRHGWWVVFERRVHLVQFSQRGWYSAVNHQATPGFKEDVVFGSCNSKKGSGLPRAMKVTQNGSVYQLWL